MSLVVRASMMGCLLLIAGATAPGAEQGTAPTVKTLTAGGVTLSMSWRAGWTLAESENPKSIGLQAADPHAMIATMTVGSIPADANADKFMSSVMDKAAKGLLSQSAEAKLDVQPIVNDAGRGYRVCATDRAPKPDEYKYLCQGILARRGNAVTFTVMFNDKGKDEADHALAALEGLRIADET